MNECMISGGGQQGPGILEYWSISELHSVSVAGTGLDWTGRLY